MQYSKACLFLLLLVNTGCEKENTCSLEEMVDLPSQLLQSAYWGNTNRPKDTQTFVVNSLAELNKVGGYMANTQSIDFTRYTLLGGVTSAPNGISIQDQRFQRDCNDHYIYSVRIEPGVAASPTIHVFGLLVDKLPSNANVKFNVQERE